MSSPPDAGSGPMGRQATDARPATRAVSARGARSRALGIVALIVVVVILISLPVTTFVVNRPELIDQASTIFGRVVAVQLVAMILAAGLALVAVITRRGRAWGIAALGILAVLMVGSLLLPLLTALTGTGASTPVR